MIFPFLAMLSSLMKLLLAKELFSYGQPREQPGGQPGYYVAKHFTENNYDKTQ